MALQTWFLDAAPYMAMITMEILGVGSNTITKAALTQGMSNLVFIVYTDLTAATFLLPLAIFRRKGTPISLLLLFKFFLFSLVGSTTQICAFTGLKYSSPTLASAIGNLTPLIACFLAVIMRMEKLNLRSSAGLAITLGTVTSVSGASIATLYKGSAILKSFNPFDVHDLYSQQSNWVVGGFFLAVTSFLLSVWFIIMTALVTEFPEKETIVFFLTFFSCINTGIYSFFMETNPNAWKLQPDIELIAIMFSAFFGEIIRSILRAWCLKNKGVVFTVMFQPLEIVLAVVMTVVFLRETLYTGSLLGGIIVTLGFYTVMWGKAKTQGIIMNYEVDIPQSSSGKAPLLLNNQQDDI